MSISKQLIEKIAKDYKAIKNPNKRSFDSYKRRRIRRELHEQHVRANYKVFEKELPNLLKSHPEHYAILHKGQVVKICKDLVEIVSVSSRMFGTRSHSLQHITKSPSQHLFNTYVPQHLIRPEKETRVKKDVVYAGILMHTGSNGGKEFAVVDILGNKTKCYIKKSLEAQAEALIGVDVDVCGDATYKRGNLIPISFEVKKIIKFEVPNDLTNKREEYTKQESQVVRAIS